MGAGKVAMGMIARYEGRLEFETDSNLQQAVELLTSSGCVEESLENGYRSENPVEIRWDAGSIIFNGGSYRNLHRVERELVELSTHGKLVGTSADHGWIGWVRRQNEYNETDLMQWAAQQGYEIPEFDDFDERVEWQLKMEDRFHRGHSM